MDKKLIASPSPHIHAPISTTRIMIDVLIALCPALIISIIVYGSATLLVMGVSIGACVLFEYLIQRFLLRQTPTLGDCSAIVTGVLLGFNLPSTLPVWIILLGALVAIGVGKMSFGGLGCNPFNPALVGRVFLLISFPVQMTTFPIPSGVDPLTESGGIGAGVEEMMSAGSESVDAVSGSTLLSTLKSVLANGGSASELSNKLSYGDMLLGFKAGSLGEIAALALLLGFLYLLYRKVITWHIPIAVLGSMALFSGVLWLANPLHYMNPLFHLLSGGALLGAIFMATDYATSPMVPRGMIIYGIGIGVITMLIRLWGAYPEGMSFAILIMNATVPLINKYVKPKRFGLIAGRRC